MSILLALWVALYAVVRLWLDRQQQELDRSFWRWNRAVAGIEGTLA